MDFFDRQQRVRRMSGRLVLLFVVAVIGIVIAVDVATITAFGAWSDPSQLIALAIVASAATGVSIALASAFRTASLRGGGGKVAIELGGVPVPQDTADPQLRRLRNVVEEIAIASGVTVPEVYLLPGEDGINAFAAGWSTSDAAVAVTRGALERLNRDELQGVIAHEFSHVVNGDMRLNIRLIGLLFGILFLTVIGRTLLRVGVFSGGGRSRGDRNSGNNPLPLIGIAMVAAGFIGVLAGRIIQASVSRQREYLADASAVQFTRQTSGIAGALKKIAGLAQGSQLRSPRTEEVGHMLFGSGRGFSSLFATHPPLADRIKVLEPSFDPAQLEELARRWAQEPPSGMREDVALGLAPAEATAQPPLPAPSTLPAPGSVMPVDAGAVVRQIAAPTNASYQRASAVMAEIPPALLARARRADTVVPFVLGLLIAEHPQARTAQHEVLAKQNGSQLADAAEAEARSLDRLDPLLRLPLAELAFPALRQRTPAEQEAAVNAVFALIHADGRISVFEYCLSRLLLGEMQDALRPKSQWRIGVRDLAGSVPAVLTLLAVLAQAGSATPAGAAAAFQAGLRRVLPGQEFDFTPPTRGVVELETVWPALDALEPAGKSLVVQAAVDVIGKDGQVTVTEAELLRTVCGLLHCPLPPLLVP
jgi:Zn-dependent protease with chaperone function